MDRRQFMHKSALGATLFTFAPWVRAAEHSNPDQLLARAVETNSPLKLKFALALGANPNHFVFDSMIGEEIVYQSVLARATSLDRLPMIKMLLDNGADIKTRTKISDCSWDNPILSNVKSTPACNLLLSCGADPNGPADATASVLYYHVKPETPKIFDHLIAKGADINALNNCGQTLLSILVAWYHSTESIRFVKLRGGLESHQVSGGSISPSRSGDPLQYQRDVASLELFESEGLIESAENYILRI